MVQLDSAPLLFGTGMAIVDIFALGGVKYLHTHNLGILRWMILPTILYAVQPWLLLKSLEFEGLAVMNILWNLMSDILVTLLGVFYFKEKISNMKLMGVGFGILALILLSMVDE